MSNNRPHAVSVTAMFLIAATAIALATGTSLLFPGTFLDSLWRLNRQAYEEFVRFGRWPGAFLIVLGAATASAARGLFHARRWAWQLTIAIFTVNGAGDLASIFAAHETWEGLTGVLIAGAFLLTLTRRHVREYFGRANR